jgi:quinohemoprotein ethanol dehydrogenase
MFDVRAPMIAPPISYQAGGKQYVTVLTGLGMGYSMNGGALIGPSIEQYGIDPRTQARRVLTFAIGGKATLPPRTQPLPPPPDPEFKSDAAKAMTGLVAYETHCSTCHGSSAVGIGNGPDLRRSAIPLDRAIFAQVVRAGLLQPRGMPKFGEFDDAKLEAIRQYLRSRSADLRAGTKAKTAPAALQIR